MEPFSRASILSLALVTPALALSACGDSLPKATATSTLSSNGNVNPQPCPHEQQHLYTFLYPFSQADQDLDPPPGWVTDFAQPILVALADRAPSFQDDFGPGQPAGRKIIVKEV